MLKDVATTVADTCVNPENKRPYPVSLILKAFKECHVSVKTNRPAKQQAAEAVAKIRESGMPIERANMRLKITVPVQHAKDVKAKLKQFQVGLRRKITYLLNKQLTERTSQSKIN